MPLSAIAQEIYNKYSKYDSREEAMPENMECFYSIYHYVMYLQSKSERPEINYQDLVQEFIQSKKFDWVCWMDVVSALQYNNSDFLVACIFNDRYKGFFQDDIREDAGLQQHFREEISIFEGGEYHRYPSVKEFVEQNCTYELKALLAEHCLVEMSAMEMVAVAHQEVAATPEAAPADVAIPAAPAQIAFQVDEVRVEFNGSQVRFAGILQFAGQGHVNDPVIQALLEQLNVGAPADMIALPGAAAADDVDIAGGVVPSQGDHQ